MPGRSVDKPKSLRKKPDFATCGGLLLALSGIIGGLILEGGKIQDVAQITAAVIVFGGTLGAVLVTTPPAVLRSAAKKLKVIFFNEIQSPPAVIDEIIRYATKARKEGIVSLEQEADAIEDPFLRKALSLAVDGMDLKELRKMMELEINLAELHAEAEAKVYEAAGGYAPTIGIIGAVLGLIQVMKHLENIDEVGRGIAVAFVATVYGVGSANIFFLPAGNKIRARMHQLIRTQEMMLEGVVAIVEGLNPKLIRSKLEAYTRHASSARKIKPEVSVRTAGAPAAAKG
jgi:chemotaxis protein MotA